MLVVGHSDTIAAVLTELGHDEAVDIPKAEFDNLWVVVPNGERPPLVTRLKL